jgi:3-deoxy-manno-octulosonate cytidylyltransferase (CMP-KDO synthetase)
MIHSKKIACIIPARLKSTRFPRKMLSLLGGKPLLQWVYESASSVPFFDAVAFAVDSDETKRLVEGFGARCFMTSEQCPSGTDRLIEVMEQGEIDADIWVNWQGDEPFITEEMIRDLLQSCAENDVDVWTLKKRITDFEEVLSPHFAKVVSDEKGFALYFSRSPIPCYRDPTPDHQKKYYKHVGLYAYTSDALFKISSLFPCDIEVAEQLEQLRFLYHGLRIRLHETAHEAFGIDLPEHLLKAETHISQRKE